MHSNKIPARNCCAGVGVIIPVKASAETRNACTDIPRKSLFIFMLFELFTSVLQRFN